MWPFFLNLKVKNIYNVQVVRKKFTKNCNGASCWFAIGWFVYGFVLWTLYISFTKSKINAKI